MFTRKKQGYSHYSHNSDQEMLSHTQNNIIKPIITTTLNQYWPFIAQQQTKNTKMENPTDLHTAKINHLKHHLNNEAKTCNRVPQK